MDQPSWLAAAWAEFGVREAAGATNASDVLSYFREAGHGDVHDDAVPWCAAFLGAMLKRAGLSGTGSLLARSYLAWGEAIDTPKPGAVAVLARGDDPGAGHVGFWIGEAGPRVFLLGGNQSDAVTVEAFDASRIIGYRWPADAAESDDAKDGSGAQDVFAVALKHVLDMEGGFSDDPYDPGGPTNRGITLSEFAKWRSETLDATSRARLISDLKRIPDALVSEIYAKRYWLPSSSPELPGAIAVMHFDASVNHGVGGAIRLLQAALGVDVDGEVGPVTLDAARRFSPQGIITRYAELRRRRYRALPHFWRFGRGWLRRVDTTEALAISLSAQALDITQTAKGKTTMTHEDDFPLPAQIRGEPPPGQVPANSGTKWWGHSKTIWGALITAAATVAPVLGPLLGLDLSGEVIKQAGEQAISAAQALAGLFGTLLTIYGRTKATLPLTRRSIALKF